MPATVASSDPGGLLPADQLLRPGIPARLLVRAETCNAARSHKLRAAEAVAEQAAAAGYRRIAVGSCGAYGLAIAIACRRRGIAATVVLPCTYTTDAARLVAAGALVVRSGGSYEAAVDYSRRLATATGAADGNVNGPFASMVLAALSGIVTDLARLLPAPPAGIWVPMGNGTTVTAVGRAVLTLGWPTRVIAVSSAGNNSILASWPSNVHVPLPAGRVQPTAANEPLCNWHALHGGEALAVLHRTGGTAVAVTDQQLKRASAAVRTYLGITASPAGAAGVAGAREHLTERCPPGEHIAILTG